MLRLSKKVRGIELIDKVSDRFTTMIEELTEGMADCDDERKNIQIQIQQLGQRDAILNSATKRARTITNNLRTLLGK